MSQPLVWGTFEHGWIFKTAVHRDGRTREDRATLFSVVTNRKYVVEQLVHEFVHALGTLAGNIDAQLAHDFDRFRTNAARPGPSAECLEEVSRVMSQQAFGHLAARRVPRAENQDAFLIGHRFLPV